MDGFTLYLLGLLACALIVQVIVTLDNRRRRKQEDYLSIRPTLFAGMDGAAMDREIRKFNRE
jgi:hypothetical protein